MIKTIPVPTIRVRSPEGAEYDLNEYEFRDLRIQIKKQKQEPLWLPSGWTCEVRRDSGEFTPICMNGHPKRDQDVANLMMGMLWQLVDH